MKYIVTGASKGIGKRCANRLLEAGNDCMLVARSREELQELAFPFENHAAICLADLADLGSIATIFENLKEINMLPLDGLVHCAGIAPLCRVDENDVEKVKKAYSVNVFSFLELMRCFVMDGICHDGASVVSISSVTAWRGSARQSIYAGTKAALEAISRCMAKELLYRKIRVNTIVSGVVETDMLQSLRNQSFNLDKKIEAHSPLGIISVDNICEIIEFLLSDKAKHITGVSLPFDSGYLL